jgi:hypothetical protein
MSENTGETAEPTNAQIMSKVNDCFTLLATLQGAIKRIADDRFEDRTGIPSTWSRRLVLVSVSAFIGAAVAASVMAARHRYEHGNYYERTGEDQTGRYGHRG